MLVELRYFLVMNCKRRYEYRYKTTNRCAEDIAGCINEFLDLPQHVSASHCHHHGVVVTSEATQAV
jgi:hypothetical protein